MNKMRAARKTLTLKNNGHPGVALVVVLLLIAILSVVVGEFVYEMRINALLAQNYQEQLRAFYVAKAGINAAKGLLKRTDPLGQNKQDFEMAGVIKVACMLSPIPPILGSGLDTGNPFEFDSEKDKKDESESEVILQDMTQRSGCGQLSMQIEYPIGDDILEMELSEEQSKINLNALVAKTASSPATNPANQGNPNPTPPRTQTGSTIENAQGTTAGMEQTEEVEGAAEDTNFRPIVLELMKLVRDRKQLQYTDKDLETMLEMLIDWLDFGTDPDGGLDDDQMTAFEYEDNIYPMKNGPMDTVGELRLIPGMTDQLYYGLEPFVTVYPYDGKWFTPKINLNSAPQEVLYALIRGTTSEGGKPTVSEQEAWEIVSKMITSGYDLGTGMTANRFNDLPTNIKQKISQYTLAGQPSIAHRYYRVISSGTTPAEITRTIQTVLQRDASGQFHTVYWQEE